MIKLKNTILTDKQGHPIRPKELPILELEYDTAFFPPIMMNGWTMNSTRPNKIFIDLGEGVPIWSADFTKVNNANYSMGVPIMHTFPNAIRRTAKVWFEHPSAITNFSSIRVHFRGLFPKELLLFNISSMTLHTTMFEEFPSVLKGGIFRTLVLQSIATTVINNIPDWITQSRITTLRLFGGVDLSNPIINNMDKLVNTKGLTNLAFSATFSPTSFPNNFKDISTLRLLGLASSKIQAIPQQLTDAKQITILNCGYADGNVSGNANFNSWGTGIGGMNLTSMRFTNVVNMPATLPIGIETCPTLKTYNTDSSYKTQLKIDAVITDAYNRVNTYASKTVGNTLLRQVTWTNSISATAFGYNNRPTGIYQQPTGYVQGSNNGTPASPMEMVWVLVNQYKWKITLTNETGNGNVVYQ